MLKNIVFDIGGVVVEYDPRQWLAERFLNKPLEDFLYERIFAGDPWKQLDAGTITQAKANALMLESCGSRRYEAQLVLDDWRDMLATKKEVLRLMEELKACGCKLYYLTNVSEEILELYREKKSFMPLFDGGIASCEEHLTKPDFAIFDRLLERYDLSPSETVYIDDNKENVDVANEKMLTAILFKGEKDLRQTLTFLGFPLKSSAQHRIRKKSANGKKSEGLNIKAIFRPGAKSENTEPKQTDIPL